jgi:hypothetical protein
VCVCGGGGVIAVLIIFVVVMVHVGARGVGVGVLEPLPGPPPLRQAVSEHGDGAVLEPARLLAGRPAAGEGAHIGELHAVESGSCRVWAGDIQAGHVEQ